MKIRTDYVTNSSSTNYIIIAKDDIEDNDILDLFGIDKESPFAFLFRDLYYKISSDMEPARDYYEKNYKKSEYKTFEEYLQQEYSKEMCDKILEAEKSGKKVFLGELDSDGKPGECFFCCDSFEIENEKIYFNGIACTW